MNNGLVQETSVTADWSDPRVPPVEACVHRYALERWARETPDAVFVRFDDGEEWTYARMLRETRAVAAGLHALGVRQGETVLMWLPNGRDALRTWFGIVHLGAIYVPINTAYRGGVLQHVVCNANARVMVLHGGLLDRLAGLEVPALRTLVVTTDTAVTAPGFARHGAEALDGDPATLPADIDIKPWHTQAVIYTSGTTGPSKGVESSYVHLYTTSAEPFPFLQQSDRCLVNGPLFHVGGTVPTSAALWRGASLALVESFKVDTFWDTVRSTRATFAVLLSSMVTLIDKQPPSPADRDHTLRNIYMIPLQADVAAFHQRFGVDVYTVFNMSEISSPTLSERNPQALGSCGKPRPGVHVRLVDDNDCEVPAGQVGEMLVRTDRPWALAHGYYRNPEATAIAWRNGWFHTGDAFRRDEAGNLYFVDRLKDAIRRRGENISSFEVEVEVCRHAAVQEAVAVAVPSELGEDEVLVVVVPRAGVTLDPAQLVGHLAERLPHFMVPRYVRTVDALPKTPTQKIEKHVLRSQGLTPDTWDRERAGIVIKRQKL